MDSGDWASTSYFNVKSLRSLFLSGGSYVSDTTLSLPSHFVLRLDAYDSDTGFTLSANPTMSSDTYPSMVRLDGVELTAVVGGFFDATQVSRVPRCSRYLNPTRPDRTLTPTPPSPLSPRTQATRRSTSLTGRGAACDT